MKVKGFLKDVGGASRVTKARQKSWENASKEVVTRDPIGEVARLLHPGRFEVTLIEKRDASPTARTLRFSSSTGHFPYFYAGQFLTLQTKIGDSLVTRPYSISSSPEDTRGKDPFVEITVRKSKGDGFFCDYLYEKAKVGDKFLAEVGLGEFHVDLIRDAHDVVCLAGGSGITPFLSMAKQIKAGKLDVNLTILYGSVSEKDIILKDELEACVCDKVKVVHVLSGENPDWKGEKGFLSAELIKKYSAKDTTYFICGPQVMYEFLHAELKKLKIPARRIRFEVFGQARDITKFEGFPKEKANDTYNLTVMMGIHKEVIPAKANESILVALERHGIALHNSCRSGACGFCRCRVLEGETFVCPNNDGRRAADKDFGYFHACSTYPLSDLTVRLPIAE